MAHLTRCDVAAHREKLPKFRIAHGSDGQKFGTFGFGPSSQLKSGDWRGRWAQPCLHSTLHKCSLSLSGKSGNESSARQPVEPFPPLFFFQNPGAVGTFSVCLWVTQLRLFLTMLIIAHICIVAKSVPLVYLSPPPLKIEFPMTLIPKGHRRVHFMELSWQHLQFWLSQFSAS